MRENAAQQDEEGTQTINSVTNPADWTEKTGVGYSLLINSAEPKVDSIVYVYLSSDVVVLQEVTVMISHGIHLYSTLHSPEPAVQHGKRTAKTSLTHFSAPVKRTRCCLYASLQITSTTTGMAQTSFSNSGVIQVSHRFIACSSTSKLPA